MRAVLAIDARNKIGEGPVWDAARQRLIWTDLELGIVHAAQADASGTWSESQRWNLARPLAAANPRRHGGLIVAGGIEVFMLDEAGTVAPFAALGADPTVVRLNDAKCDPRGRLWAGTLAFDFTPRGALYRIDADGSVHTMLEKLYIANGMAWSPDGSVFYFADSLTQRVDAFDFDVERGTISRRRTFVAIAHGEGGPNGLTVDAEGCVWVAVTGSGRVRRYSPNGALLSTVEIGTPGATSCAFGGADGADLFITSLGRRMPEVARTLGLTDEMMNNDGRELGGVFVCRPGVTGRAATPFAG
jgi:sugar lactone lactonase YvrE